MKKYLAVLRQSFFGNLVYFTNALSWGLIAVMELIVPIAIWMSAIPIGSTFAGFTRNQLLAYYGLMTLIGNITFWWVNFAIEEDIRNGDLSNILTKPLSYIGYIITNNLGDKLIAVIIRLPIFIFVMLFFSKEIFSNLSFSTALLTIFATVLGSMIYMFISVCFGLISFWITSSRGFMSIYFVAVYLFSGQLAPLSFYPDWFRSFANLLPYRFTLSFPIELLLGKMDQSQLMHGLVSASIWVILLGLLTHYLWRKGAKLYQAYGK